MEAPFRGGGRHGRACIMLRNRERTLLPPLSALLIGQACWAGVALGTVVGVDDVGSKTE